jgi:type II secretory pathway pseudopilin PulG
MLFKVSSLLANQRGAMFGIDARIALIIASVLAATTGVTVMSRLDSNKREASERGVLVLRDAIENYYRNVGVTSLPANIAALFTAGLVEDSTLQNDPWGGSWNYNTISVSKSVDGVPVTVNMAVVHSSGPDGVNDSVSISAENEYAAWVPANDDVGTKFSSVMIEKERVARYRHQGRQIVDKLEAQESGRFLTATNTCSATPADSICSHSGTSHTQYNYYPKSDLDSGSAVYFDPDVTSTLQTYTSGDSSDMQQLMADIGLPSAFATDPWNRTLHYSSNATNRTSPPFTASICFSSGGSCF